MPNRAERGMWDGKSMGNGACGMEWNNGGMRRVFGVVLLLTLASPAAGQIAGTRAAALARDGWRDIDAGRPAVAEPLFTEAIALEPRDPSLLLGAALAAHLQGQSGRARPLLERALELNARYVPAAMLLGEVCYRLGDIETAIRTYAQVLDVAPAQEVVRTKLDAWRREAALHSRFFQAPGAHFVVLFEGPGEARLAARALEVLESGYWRVGTALGVFPIEPMVVVLYTQEQFRDITRSPDWAAAVYDGRIRVPMRGAIENAAELERVLVHELTHALVRGVAPRHVPTWLNEGIAVYFEPEGRAWAEAEAAKTTRRMTPAALAGRFDSFAGGDARLAYAESALAVQKMTDLAGSTGLMALVADLGQGVPFEEAFERRLLVSYADFMAQLQPQP